MKKLFFFLIVFFSICSINAQTYKFYTTSFAYKYYENNRWTDWSDWERSRMLVVIFGDDAQAYFNLLNNMSYGKPDSIAGIANLKPAYFVTPKDSDWSDTAFAWFCIGYNQTITPIQTLTFYNAIANNGKMVQPQLYKDSTTVINPQIASQANIDSLKQALEYVVTDGLAQSAKSDNVQVAGETGTVQLEDGSYIVEFCGYFPANAPQYSIIVSIHKEGLPASGGLMAGDVFRQIINQMI